MRYLSSPSSESYSKIDRLLLKGEKTWGRTTIAQVKDSHVLDDRIAAEDDLEEHQSNININQ